MFLLRDGKKERPTELALPAQHGARPQTSPLHQDLDTPLQLCQNWALQPTQKEWRRQLHWELQDRPRLSAEVRRTMEAHR